MKQGIKKTFRTVLCALCCALMCFSAVACNSNVFRFDEEELDKVMNEVLDTVDFTADESYAGTLRIVTNQEPDQITIMNALLGGFKKKYPSITVDYKNYPSAGYKDTLTNMNSACTLNGKYDTFPDVFWASNTDVTEYQSLDMLMPVDYFDGRDDSFDFGNLVKIMVDDCKVGEHVYLMPRDSDRMVMYYNKDFLAKAGVSEEELHPDRALTKSEFLALMEKCTGVKNDDGKDVSALDAFWNWESLLWPLLHAYGGSVVKEENGVTTSALNSPETLETYKFIKELNIKGYMTEGGTGNYWRFKNKLSVFLFGVRATLTDLAANVSNIGVVPMPNLHDDESRYFVGTGCSGYAMYRHAANPTAAWLFQKYVASEEGQNAISATGNNIPVLKKLFDDENAVWRNVTVNGDASFNHDAYIYKYDTASLTAQTGYRELIKPITAIKEVSKAFEDSIKYVLQNTTADDYLDEKNGIPKFLRSYHRDINNAIKIASGN
ncbi:MAG: extracellular solute-binding protein [Clostridia bacterium]|nr:extracellular solute-binding protein [Clostridia bacterium]